MNIETISIPFGFAMLGTLLLWIIIMTKGKWWLKAIAISATLYFTFGVWHSIDTYSGWPTKEELPEDFVVHWFLVKEPNKIQGTPGAVYLWVTARKLTEEGFTMTTPFQYPNTKKKPRVYHLEYSKQLHKDLDGMKGNLRNGRGVRGKKGKGGKGGKGKGEGEKGKGNSGRTFTEKGALEFHIIKPPRLPDKNL